MPGAAAQEIDMRQHGEPEDQSTTHEPNEADLIERSDDLERRHDTELGELIELSGWGDSPDSWQWGR